MESRQALDKFKQISSILLKPDISFLYPRDIEVYMMALELADKYDNMIDYFAFPIMPQSIVKNETQIVNTKKTMGGVTVLSTNSSPIQNISIKGDFGRTFKLLLNPNQPSTEGYAFSINAGVYDLYKTKTNTLSVKVPPFLDGIKTGFGSLNILRSIISKSTGSGRSNSPFRLYMYNMALGESYLCSVKPEGLTVSQNLEKNMIWQYSLTLDILAPLELVRAKAKQSSSKKAVAFASIQRDLNKKLTKIASIL